MARSSFLFFSPYPKHMGRTSYLVVRIATRALLFRCQRGTVRGVPARTNPCEYRPRIWAPRVKEQDKGNFAVKSEPKRPRLTARLLAVLSLLAMTSPLATDMYLPAFTEISVDLHTSAPTVQLTLTTFLLGIGIGQLFFGPLSDRHGRRRILLLALTTLVLVSVALIFVPNIGWMVALRFAQGFMGAGGVVLSRAIAVDVAKGAAAVRALSLIATVVALAPLIAPLIGGVISQFSGWRVVFATLAGLTILMLAMSAALIPETLPVEERHSGRLTTTFGAIGSLLKDKIFVGYMITFSAMFGAMMAYISASPFIGQSILGMNQLEYGFSFATGATALIVANLINARVANTIGAKKMQIFGVSVSLLAGLYLLTIILANLLSIPLFIVAAFFITLGAGFTMSNTSALALMRAEHARGSASALLGFSQFFVGGAVSPLVGVGGEFDARPAGFTIVALAIAAFAFALMNRWARGQEEAGLGSFRWGDS